MRIIELRAENFKRITAVAIKPDGDIVTITGANNAGKSSVVDSIFAALQARRMLKDIPEPVRTGEKSATITLDLGEYIVVREIEPSGRTRLKVTEKTTGVPVKSPQSVIDGLLESLSIDPSAFIQCKGAEQVEILIGMADGEGFLKENEAQREQWYDHRTAKGRIRDQCKAVFDAAVKPDLPDTKPDPKALKEIIDYARELVSQMEQHERTRSALAELITKTEHDLLDLEEKSAFLQNELNGFQSQLGRTTHSIEALPPVQDIAVLEEEYAQSLKVLAKFDQMEKWGDAGVKYEAASAEYDEATNSLDIIKSNRDAWLGAAELPVEGLTFDLDTPCVKFNGIPLAQASSSEQLRIGTAIAMACNPGLRVIRVRDGNCLDSESFAMLADMAKKNDFQLWIEKVDESGEIGFYIEDGSVVAVDGQPVK